MTSSKHIWIVNPFDQLPNESDIPLRFWSLSKVLAKKGYKVTWWSSDFSHNHKTSRLPCPDIDGFSIRLVKTPPYKNNISLSRILSHYGFSRNFYREAIKQLKTNTLEKPFRIIVSLPPLGVAEMAFKLRDYINENENKISKNSELKCKVIVDIMDAWPEVFYRIFPTNLKTYIVPLLLFFFHRSAMIAYKNADKISAVGNSYLEIAKNYLNTNKFLITSSITTKFNLYNDYPYKPLHLCYHGVDLNRFNKKTILNRLSKFNQITKSKKQKINNLKIVYIGSMNSGYDLKTIISVAEKWKYEGEIPLQIHFAGKGEMLNYLKKMAKGMSLLYPDTAYNAKSKIIFHGHLKNDEIKKLLLSSDIALVTNRSETLVACPYKASEYSGAGLSMISCLGGDFNKLIDFWDAGLSYLPDNTKSLFDAIQRYSKDFELLKKHNINARKMAEHIFDRNKTYKLFANFITSK